MLEMKFWMKVDDDLHTFEIHPKAQNLCKCFFLLAITSYPTQQTWIFFHICNHHNFISNTANLDIFSYL